MIPRSKTSRRRRARGLRLAGLLTVFAAAICTSGAAPAADTIAVSGAGQFVRVSPRDARYFELADGRPYVPVGFNLVSAPQPEEMERVVERMARHGVNYCRIWLDQELRAFGVNKPIILTETGAVKPRHTGASELYEKDKAGMLLHDMLFAPFFCGAAGTGHAWFWRDAIDRPNLWRHFARFQRAVEGIDPPAEDFRPVKLDQRQQHRQAEMPTREKTAVCLDALEQRSLNMIAVHLQYAVAMPLKFCAVMLALATAPAAATADEPAALPGTKALDWQGDPSERMMEGLHRFVERKIDESVGKRPKLWRRDFASIAAYEKSIEPNRQRLRKIAGVVDPRVPVRMERFGDDDNPALVARSDRFCVYQVRWPVLDGVWGEGLLLQPNNKPSACAVAIPDAEHTPEQAVGLSAGVPADAQFARRLAEAGIQVIVPVVVDRSDEWSGNADVAWTNQPHREWIYRQAYHMGRHVIGYEVQKVLAAVDWFKERGDKDVRVGVMGHGEGGLLALYAAACDPRIDACLTSGYFQLRQRVWTEPLYRNVWGFLAEFGDAELATLVAPRGLIVEHSEVSTVTGPPPVRLGRRGGAAAGAIATPEHTAVADEFARIGALLRPGFQARHLVTGPENRPVGPGSEPAMKLLLQMLGVQGPPAPPGAAPHDERRSFNPAERQRRQVKELEGHVQRLVRSADRTRDQFFFSKVAPESDEQHRRWTTNRRVTTFPAEPFIERTRPYRQYFREEVLGKFDDPLLPPGPRTRKIYDRPRWAGYEYVLDVYPDVFAWGVLLLPKGLNPGERRPVVVCQHGRGAVPKDVIEGKNTAYNDFAAQLADRGFIVVAPHNPYRGEDRYRYLCRKANTVKASLFSFIISQHEQLLNWLQSLPSVDPQRIAFYGLSYGGETAVRVPTVLEGYCLSICSGDFNDWARKVAATDSRYSFMFTVEWEMPYFDMGSTFNYAETAYLMVPRPFMVERGHSDNVAPDEWVAYEYAKVRRMYDELDLGDRTEIEFFPGGHSINGQRTFQFLERHLRWPPN